MEEKAKQDIIDYFIKCYVEKKYPADLKIKNYSEWRKFREFWLIHWELSLQDAIDYYLVINKDELL